LRYRKADERAEATGSYIVVSL